MRPDRIVSLAMVTLILLSIFIVNTVSADETADNLVDATLRESRNSVTKRSSEGNVDNSSASFDDKVITKMATANDILQARSISSMGVGIRIKRVARTETIPTTKMVLLYAAKGVSSIS